MVSYDSIGEMVSDLIDVFITIVSVCVFDCFIPIGQALVPGSPKSIWSSSHNFLLVILVILLGVYIVADKMTR